MLRPFWKEMRKIQRTYYYARVSSTEQNLDRQLEAFKAMGADERDIITDKASGRDMERAGYKALKSAILRQGDTLVIKSLDRLSRNKTDIRNELDSLDKQFLPCFDKKYSKMLLLQKKSDIIKMVI